MPTDDRFRFDNEEHILPARPGRPQDCPEEPIQKAQLRPRPFPLQNGYLLAKGEDLEGMSVRLWKKTRAAAIRARRTGSMNHPF